MKAKAILLSLLFCLGTSSQQSFAMIMPYPASVKQLMGSASLVVKAKVLSIEPITATKDIPVYSSFWKVQKAHLQIISNLKGTAPSKQIDVFYRGAKRAEKNNDATPDIGAESDAHYNLQPNKSYILFLRKSANGAVYHQLVTHPTMRSWEGFIEASDDKPVSDSLKCEQIIFDELKKQLNSKDNYQVANAAFNLLEMSSNTEFGCSCTNDYSRKLVMETIFSNQGQPPKALSTEKILPDFLQCFSISPYLRDDRMARYICTKAGVFPTWSNYPKVDSSNLIPALPFLIEIANSKRDLKVRKNAILALGTGERNEEIKAKVEPQLKKWLDSSEPVIKASACLLASDYPDLISDSKRIELLKDQNSEIRDAIVMSIAFTQKADDATIKQLENLLKDRSNSVKGHAALALVSLPFEKTKNILISNLHNQDFGTAFLARITKADPALVHKELIAECRTKLEPSSGVPKNDAQMVFQNALGTYPQHLVRKTLSNYLKSLPADQLKNKANAELVNCLKGQPEFKI